MTLSSEEKKEKIASHLKEVLLLLGLDLSGSLAETPNRVAKMYVDEVFTSLSPDSFPKLALFDAPLKKEMVLVKNISFVSFCEHHFVPMVGKVHIAYLPNERLLGVSKIPQIVHYFSKRPQLQEKLTVQIADALASLLHTESVAVVVQALHFCMIARNQGDVHTQLETHVIKGRFEKEDSLKTEFFSRLPKEHVC